MFRKKIDKYLQKGQRYFETGDFTKAKDYYLKALSINPNDLTALNNLAQIYFILNDTKKAEGYNELLLDKCETQLQKEKTERVLVLKLSALSNFNRIDETNEICNQILEMNPKNTTALIYKSQYFEEKQNLKKSIENLDKVLKIDENDITALLYKGRNLTKQKKYDEAENCFNHVLRLHHQNIAAFNLKSELLKQKYNVKITPYDFIIESFGYWNRKEFENALKSIRKATQSSYPCDEAWFIQGVMYLRIGQVNNSINSFKKAFEINPHSFGVKNKDKLLKKLEKMLKINRFLHLEK